MKIYYEIEDTADPFYLAAKQCGQAMGFAIPHLLARNSVFNIVYSESGSPMLYDKQGKSYRCHFSGNERYNLAPAFMKGYGREYSAPMIKKYVSSVDYHILAKHKGNTITVEIVDSVTIMKGINEQGSYTLKES